MNKENPFTNLFGHEPWEDGEFPYFVNEEGNEWYIDKVCTESCTRRSNLPKLNAICFLVAELKGNSRELIGRVLIDIKSNDVINTDEAGLESMLWKITAHRAAKMKPKRKKKS